MDCIVLAGGIPRPEDPLFPHTQGKPKALIRIGQAAMIEYVLQGPCRSEECAKNRDCWHRERWILDVPLSDTNDTQSR